jgi:predicted DNA binding CopG/RHH family protein
MKKKFPNFKSDREAEEFVAKADLTEYDFSDMKQVRFELKPKDKSVNLRLSADLLAAIRKQAKKLGIPYQRFMRLKLEQALHSK